MSDRKFASFGYDCRAGFQIRRYFGKEKCAPTIFDRQVTPPDAICAYLDNDFEGMFEAGDVERVGGYLFNMRYGVRYSHEVEDAFKVGYEAGAAEHERLCQLTREALLGTVPLLLVIHKTKAFRRPEDLGRKVGNYSTAHEVLVIEDASPVPPGQAAWRGNNDFWDLVLAPYGEKLHVSPWATQTKRLKRHFKRFMGGSRNKWEG
ncbi:hypothetical protein [Hyphomicrobium sp. ghe19]|uniref:hypothetical protein n=1 Tax=Hyphomicrobium sp. ghe19 TaxID=2682968 RepID=UPI00136764FB|nr:hypothetical protein HYPP_01509 [Hyphomicrobium sp. ghe19]